MLSFYLSALESAADKEDFRALYRRYHGVMERTALAILQDPRDAEEAVQEAFIRVIENFSKILINQRGIFQHVPITSRKPVKPDSNGVPGFLPFGEVPVSWRIPAHLDGRE